MCDEGGVDVIKIMGENGNIDMNNADGGEIEMDMSDLQNRTLWKLDAYLKEHNVKPPDLTVNTVSGCSFVAPG